ncbi:MAG: PEP-CTERM sorting domain-containing protein [Aquincola tertiaricarbonis]
MSIESIPRAAVAAAMLAIATSTAARPVIAEATLGPIAVQLEDLDLSDGITPSITFTYTGGSPTYILIGNSQNGGGQEFSVSGTAPSGWGNFQRTESTGSTSAAVVATSSGTLIGTSLSARSSVEETPRVGVGDIAYATAQQEIGLYEGSFVLSANTRANFTAAASIRGSLSQTIGAQEQVGATVALVAADAEYFATQYDRALLSESVVSPPSGQATFEQASFFSVSVSNIGSAAQTRYLGATLYTGASFYGPVREVPEPAAYTLFASGLGALIALGRRRWAAARKQTF